MERSRAQFRRAVITGNIAKQNWPGYQSQVVLETWLFGWWPYSKHNLIVLSYFSSLYAGLWNWVQPTCRHPVGFYARNSYTAKTFQLARAGGNHLRSKVNLLTINWNPKVTGWLELASTTVKFRFSKQVLFKSSKVQSLQFLCQAENECGASCNNVTCFFQLSIILCVLTIDFCLQV